MIQEDIVEANIYTEVNPEEARHNTVVETRLSNGITSYSQVNRRSWLELKAWLAVNENVHITGMYFRFRDNLVTIGEGPGTYFFSYGGIAWCGGPTQKQFIGGILDGEYVKRKKYVVPELLLIEEDEVHVSTDYLQKGLIKCSL